MHPRGLAVVSMLMLWGCAGPAASTRGAASMAAARDVLVARDVLAACCPGLPKGPWVEAPSRPASQGPAQTCWACPEGGGVLACAFEEAHASASDDGAVRVAGTLRCTMDRRAIRDVVVVAATEAPADPARLRALGQVRLDARLDRGAVDRLPHWEDARLPFILSLSDEGVPLDPDRRLVLFGVVTSEDGSAVVTALRLGF